MSTLETNLIQPATGTALTVGASGDTITVPSGATLTAPGHILQVVTGTRTTTSSTNSTSFVTADLSASITPSSSSNKVFIMASFDVAGENPYSGGAPQWTLYRDSTNLGNATNGMASLYTNVSGWAAVGLCLTNLDSPSSTSSITYAVYQRTQNASYAAVLGADYNGAGQTVASITLLEVAG